MIKKIIFMALIISHWSMVNAQTISRQVIAGAGGTLSGGGHQITFTLGETVISSFTGGGTLLTQGFQQPGEQIITGNVSAMNCAGSTISVPFTSVDILPGNIYTAQLSDAAGSFGNPVALGTLSGNAASGVISALIPPNTPASTTYRIRVVGSLPATIGTEANSSLVTPNITINPLPTATIAGTTAVCQNAPFPQITFTGSGGTAPYTFTYNINGVGNFTVVSNGNIATLSQTTAMAGVFNYTLVSVKDASSTQCSQNQGGSATITVNAPPSLGSTPASLCTGQTLTLSPNTGGTWQSSNPSIAGVTPAGFVTAVAAGVVYFTFTETLTGCSAKTADVIIKQTPTSNLTASKVDVCPNTEVTLNANCSIPTSTIQWNPGGPTVTPAAATLPYVYKASCTADGCTGNESSVEVRTHRILVDMKDLDVGALPKAIVRSVKDNMEPTNLIQAPAFPRRWTFIATGCDASESAVFKLSGPVNFNTIDNAATYAMFANDAGGFYSLDHPNYGNGGSFPNGTYTLTIDLHSKDGVGGPFPKNRVAMGSLLATRTLQFTVGSPAARQAVGSESFTVSALGFAEISPNPVSNTMRLKVSEAKGQNVNVSLIDASGRTMLQRSFVPETNQHQEEFEVSEIANGVYFLKVNAGEKQATLKVVKVQ